MTEYGQPGRLAYGCGLVLGVLLLLASIYFIIDEWQRISQALVRQKVLITFNANIGWFAGGVLAATALILLCIPMLLSDTIRPRIHGVISWMFVAAVFGGLICRVAADAWMGDYLERQGYVFCPERSEVQPRSRKQGWVLDDALCDIDLDIDEMTLPELRHMLS